MGKRGVCSPRDTRHSSKANQPKSEVGLRVRAVQILLRARLRYPHIALLQDPLYCTECITQFLDARDEETFTVPFEQEAGTEIFEAFQDLRNGRLHQNHANTSSINLKLADVNIQESVGPSLRQDGFPKSAATRRKLRLWEFILCLLQIPELGDSIRWTDKSSGTFEFVEDKGTRTVAELWGLAKNNGNMNYDKLSRSLREYYGKILNRQNSRLQYQFNLKNPSVCQLRDALADGQEFAVLPSVREVIRNCWDSKFIV
ncbi:unnamed protein product [Calicophoron daubneyi]|uniref:ETS domain-containing protein n=1 Tax=Calicophoron daubneyi TaxID=300641 RepID=A0AAV2TFV7_CALDB